MGSLDQIRVHPVKALDATSVDSATIVEGGGLEWDRRYAIVEAAHADKLATNPHGAYVNGKRERRVHELTADYELDRQTITVSHDGDTQRFHLEDDRAAFADWLSAVFGYEVTVVRDDEGGYPDDTTAAGPTLISAATLDAVAGWYDGIDAAEMCRRLRPNLVVDGVDPFWDDRLYDTQTRVVPFTVGPTTLHGVNPCQRCVVPSRDPETGAETPGFRETFVDRRKETLPEWASNDWFDHYFRLMVNTHVPESSWGAALSVGDELSIGEPIPSPLSDAA